VPTILAEETKKIVDEFTEDGTKADILAYVTDVLDRRKKKMEELLIQVKSKKEEK
jgi:hypothetical protein